MTTWNTLASDEQIARTVAALETHGITTTVVADRAAAKAFVLGLLPEKAEVMNMNSVTLDEIGLSDAIVNSGTYHAVRKTFAEMNKDTQAVEMRKLGAGAEWVVGSVHAVTEQGNVLIASASGSQLPAYAYGSMHVIWVVGTQKIVSSVEDGMKRVYDYVLPLESERAKKAYGVQGSAVNKMLIVNSESQKGRIQIVFVKESLGF